MLSTTTVDLQNYFLLLHFYSSNARFSRAVAPTSVVECQHIRVPKYILIAEFIHIVPVEKPSIHCLARKICSFAIAWLPGWLTDWLAGRCLQERPQQRASCSELAVHPFIAHSGDPVFRRNPSTAATAAAAATDGGDLAGGTMGLPCFASVRARSLFYLNFSLVLHLSTLRVVVAELQLNFNFDGCCAVDANRLSIVESDGVGVGEEQNRVGSSGGDFGSMGGLGLGVTTMSNVTFAPRSYIAEAASPRASPRSSSERGYEAGAGRQGPSRGGEDRKGWDGGRGADGVSLSPRDDFRDDSLFYADCKGADASIGTGANVAGRAGGRGEGVAEGGGMGGAGRNNSRRPSATEKDESGYDFDSMLECLAVGKTAAGLSPTSAGNGASRGGGGGEGEGVTARRRPQTSPR